MVIVKFLNFTLIVDQVLCKVTCDLRVCFFLEPLEKIVCVFANAFYLSDNWELDFESLCKSIFYLFLGLRLLLAELVTWESNYLKTTLVVCLVHINKLLVMRFSQTLAGYVDYNRCFCILCKKIHCAFSCSSE